jgi:FkbM family methyltransferase
MVDGIIMKLSKKILRKLGIVFNLNTVGRAQRAWVTAGGDDALRYNAELSSGDIVFDLGGYEGEFTSRMMKDGVQFHIFEISPVMIDLLNTTFKSSPMVSVHPFGLGHKNIQGRSVGSGSGAGFMPDESDNILIRDFVEFVDELAIDRIDLLKVNIEGPAYDLIEHLDRAGILQNIHELQIQAHDFEDDCFDRLLSMHRILSKTHRLVSSHTFVWDFWVRRDVK